MRYDRIDKPIVESFVKFLHFSDIVRDFVNDVVEELVYLMLFGSHFRLSVLGDLVVTANIRVRGRKSGRFQ